VREKLNGIEETKPVGEISLLVNKRFASLRTTSKCVRICILLQPVVSLCLFHTNKYAQEETMVQTKSEQKIMLNVDFT